MPLNAGLVIPRGSASDLIGRVAQAERRGIATAWTTVGGPTADPVTALAAAGAATDQIGLGTAVSPTYPRHPITLAAQALAMHDPPRRPVGNDQALPGEIDAQRHIGLWQWPLGDDGPLAKIDAHQSSWVALRRRHCGVGITHGGGERDDPAGDGQQLGESFTPGEEERRHPLAEDRDDPPQRTFGNGGDASRRLQVSRLLGDEPPRLTAEAVDCQLEAAGKE
jgi:hypothetical protein